MTSSTPSLNAQGIIQGLVDVAASQAVPGPIGSILFPKPSTDVFKQLQDRIEKPLSGRQHSTESKRG